MFKKIAKNRAYFFHILAKGQRNQTKNDFYTKYP